MKYVCKRCENVIDVPKKQTNGATRKTHACQRCNDMVTFERLDHDYTNLTDAQRHFLRSIHTEIRVSTKSKNTKHIHIIDDEDTLCNHDIDTRKVDVSAYPLGYLDWCQHCLARTKRSKEDVEEGTSTSKEAAKRAVQYANEKVSGTITIKEYEELDITPSVWTIKKVFGSWSDAKEQCL